MPLIASMLSRTPTVCMPRHAPWRPDSGVDLQVQVEVRVPGARGVVPDLRGLDLLHRDLDLPPPRTDPGRRVLEPTRRSSRLPRGPGPPRRPPDLRVHRRRERPRLGTIDHHLHEPHRLPSVRTRPLARPVDVDATDPSLVGRAVQRAAGPHTGRTTAGRLTGSADSDVTLGQTSALGQVVVIGPRAVGLDVGPRSSSRPAIDLHPAMHAHITNNQPQSISVNYPRNANTGHPKAARSTNIRSIRAVHSEVPSK